MPPRPDTSASAPAQDAAQTGDALMMNGDKVIVIVDPYSTGCVVAQEALKRAYKLVVVWTKGVGENKTHGELCVSISLFVACIFYAPLHFRRKSFPHPIIIAIAIAFAYDSHLVAHRALYRIIPLLELFCCSSDVVC